MNDRYKTIIPTALGTIVLLASCSYNTNYILTKTDIVSSLIPKNGDFLDTPIFPSQSPIEIDGLIETEESTIEDTKEYTEETILETTEDIEETISDTLDVTSEVPTETIEVIDEIVDTQPTIDNEQNFNLGAITKDTEVYCNNNEYSISIGELKISDRVVKLLSVNNYDLIKTDELLGFIESENAEYTEIDDIDNIEYSEINDIGITYTSTNFRDNPSLDSNIIRTLPVNSELNIYALVDDTWYLASCNDEVGYIHADYVKLLSKQLKEEYPESNLESIKVEKNVYINTDALNIRKSNTIDSESIGSLYHYENVRVLDEDDSWYFIMTNDYHFGYIAKKYTKELDGIYVIVDVSEQRAYLYNNHELLYKSLVTTGKDSTSSDIGLFKIFLKERNCVIAPPNEKTFVSYWMPFNNSMEGLHDASWRSVFGEQDYHYNGSNGCINMPHEFAKKYYNTVSVGTKVLVHK